MVTEKKYEKLRAVERLLKHKLYYFGICGRQINLEHFVYRLYEGIVL
jgi:hypothetical protein